MRLIRLALSVMIQLYNRQRLLCLKLDREGRASNLNTNTINNLFTFKFIKLNAIYFFSSENYKSNNDSNNKLYHQ